MHSNFNRFHNFIQTFEKLTTNHSNLEIFQDFLTLSACSISNSVDKANFKEREDSYLNAIRKYLPHECDLFPKLLADIVLQMENDKPNYRDTLGEIFNELRLRDVWKGQFFTPDHICQLMAKIIIGDCQADINAHGFTTICDPCCGGGALLLAAIAEMFKSGLKPYKQALFVANDIDIRCVHMTYIQLSLAGVPAIVCHKNSLTDETFSEWVAPVFIFDRWYSRISNLKE